MLTRSRNWRRTRRGSRFGFYRSLRKGALRRRHKSRVRRRRLH